MKFFSLLFIFIFSTQAFAQQIVSVSGTRSSQTYINIDQIRNTDMWTEVVLSMNPSEALSATLHGPTGKSPFMLKDRQGNEHLLVYQKGWDGPNPGGYGSIQLAVGQKKIVSLFFNKIDKLENIYSLNESNCEGSGCWFFNDIIFANEVEGAKWSKPGVKFYKTWIDYNVRENGDKGMRIHTNFHTLNLIGVKCRLVVRVRNEEDEYIKTSNTSYSVGKGELGVIKSLIPGAQISNYSDLSVFLSYSAFELEKGEHKLKIDLDLYPMSGDMIEHINFYNFKFTEN